jgi:hypothetical protein
VINISVADGLLHYELNLGKWIESVGVGRSAKSPDQGLEAKTDW